MKEDNKKFYWIKLRTDFFNRDDIDFILSQKNGCEYIVLYQMLCLKSANNNGRLATEMNEMIIPYDINKIVRDMKHFDYDTVAVALELFKKMGLIYEEQDRVLRISGHENMIGFETEWAEKKRAYRKKQYLLKMNEDNVKDNVEDNVLKIEDNVRQEIEIEKEIEKEININISSNSSSYKEKKNFEIYEKILDNFHNPITPLEKETIDKWCNEFSNEMLIEAIRIATINQHKTIGYVSGILKNWKDKGFKNLDDLNKHPELTTEQKEILEWDWLNDTEQLI